MFAPAREHEHGTEAGLGHNPFHVVTAFPSWESRNVVKFVQTPSHLLFGHPAERIALSRRTASQI